MRRVVITGIGPVTCIGTGVGDFWSAALAGRSGIRRVEHLEIGHLRTRIAGFIPEFRPQGYADPDLVARHDRCTHLGVAAAQLALGDAGLEPGTVEPHRMGVFMGTGLGGIFFVEKHLYFLAEQLRRVPPHAVAGGTANSVAGQIAVLHGLRGPNLTLSTACSSAAHAIGLAVQHLRAGTIDVALAGGAEAPVTPLIMAGFSNLRATSARNDAPERASRPFDRERDGFVLAEGAALLVLESADHAAARGARIYAEVSGYGASCDGFHMALPRADGAAAAAAVAMALADAGVGAADVDGVSAHATGTGTGDLAEAAVIVRALGSRAGVVSVTATKSLMGHALGAAAALQVALGALALRSGMVPPTANLEDPDPGCALDIVRGRPRHQALRVLLINSFGFWGNNACLVLTRAA